MHPVSPNSAFAMSLLAHDLVIPITVAPRYNAVVGVHDIEPRCKQGALGVPISATRELLNNSDRHPLHQVHAVEAPCACSTVLYANMQFMELIKLFMLASTCIIFKCHTLMILELNRSTTMMMYWPRQ